MPPAAELAALLERILAFAIVIGAIVGVGMLAGDDASAPRLAPFPGEASIDPGTLEPVPDEEAVPPAGPGEEPTPEPQPDPEEGVAPAEPAQQPAPQEPAPEAPPAQEPSQPPAEGDGLLGGLFPGGGGG